MALGTLYLIPCPISDATPTDAVLPAGNRAAVDSLDYFIVEDERSARRFLSRYGVSKPIDSMTFVRLDEHTQPGAEVERMVEPLLHGRSAGVISEAGCPAVADPGQLVVEACHRHGIRVVPLVGPSSILMAVMASGLGGQTFAFNGYVPVREPDRSRTLKRLESRALAERQPQAVIEAPYRNVKFMEQILKTCAPTTRLCVATDVTSPNEYIRTASVGEWRKAGIPDINKRPTIFIIGR